MELRTAKRGPNAGGLVWGCSDYPRCKGIHAYPSANGVAGGTLPSVAATTPIAPPGPAPTCPECESEMVMKVAHKGRNAGRGFWACPRYPECHGTRDVGAGSEKSEAIVARSVECVRAGADAVLVMCFNLTLVTYLRDRIRFRERRVGIDTGRITVLHWHGWAKESLLHIPELQWRIHFRLEAPVYQDAIGAMTRPLVDERGPEVENLIARVEAQITEPAVPEHGLAHMFSVADRIAVSGHASASTSGSVSLGAQ